MKMFTTIAVATALLGLAACSKNEPAPAAEVTATTAAPADNTLGGGSAKPAETGAVQPK